MEKFGNLANIPDARPISEIPSFPDGGRQAAPINLPLLVAKIKAQRDITSPRSPEETGT